MEPILFFNGQWRFLSNFYRSPFTAEGVRYTCVENAYQAAKTTCPTEKLAIARALTPSLAKRLGNSAQHIHPNWDTRRLPAMEWALRQKFKHPELRSRLIATGERELQEGNSWGDTYWGVVHLLGGPIGENQLGKLLMKLRAEYAAEGHSLA